MHIRKPLMALALLTLLIACSAAAAAQCAPVTGGFTRTVSASSVGGTFVPTQTHVEDTFYRFPGISAFGPYPGAGYAYQAGVGFTPLGYMPYQGFAYL